MSDFASRVRDARKAKGWSQKQLAEAVAASQAQVSQIETGKLEPAAELRSALMTTLDLGDDRGATSASPTAPEPAKRLRKPKADKAAKPDKPDKSGADLGFESLLWASADKLRNNMDVAEYKHVVLGLVFLKYISDASLERSVVRTLVAMLAPYKRRVFDPCCGSGGMFVQSEKFIEAHGGRLGDISVYGQESNPPPGASPR